MMSLYPLKPKQLEAIQTFMSAKDTYVSLPTGYTVWVCIDVCVQVIS